MTGSKTVCEHCTKQFSNKSNWTRHLKVVHSRNVDGELITPTNFSCDICNKVFKEKRVLDTHVRSVHCSADDNMYNCKKCDFKTSDKYNLKEHIVQHHSDKNIKPFKCFECDSCYISKSALNHHMKTKHKTLSSISLKRKCPICPYVALGKSQQIINKHFEKVHNTKLHMENHYFDTISDFDSWKTQIERETTSFFKIQQSYSNKDFYTITYRCHRSGTFSSTSLNKRIKKLAGSCKINGFCPASIKLKCKNNQVSVIYQALHVGHKCELKHLRLTKEERADIATQIATGKPHDIVMNDIRSSVANSKLCRIHLTNKKDIINIENSFNLHEQELKHPSDPMTVSKTVCEHCTKQFSNKSNWTRHMKVVHSRNVDGELITPTNFSCDICNKVFKEKRVLDTHVRSVHCSADDNIYNCKKCAFKTSDKQNLKEHIVRHHGDKNIKPFKCFKCDCCYTSKSALNYHKKAKHNTLSSISLTRKCPICPYVALGKSQQIINKHFENVHNTKLKQENHSFQTISDFYSWKTKIERETNSFFKIHQTYFNKDLYTITYRCHRSGTFSSTSLNKRRMKLAGSCKINGFCPAAIKVKDKNNKVSVIYQPLHVGHKCELKHLRLTKEEREDIATHLASGKPHEIVIKHIRSSVSNSKLCRIHLTNKKDIVNIENSFNLHEEATKYPSDPVSVLGD